MIADRSMPESEETIRANPPLRVEYEQAIAIGDLESCLSCTRSKNWGAGPWVMPLDRDDPVDPVRVLYVYRENSLQRRRFVQRQRMKQLLGRKYRKLVKLAMRNPKERFLELLTEEQATVIRRKFGVDVATFWRVVRGRVWLDLPGPVMQLEFEFEE
jgi:hypothetical protein